MLYMSSNFACKLWCHQVVDAAVSLIALQQQSTLLRPKKNHCLQLSSPVSQLQRQPKSEKHDAVLNTDRGCSQYTNSTPELEYLQHMYITFKSEAETACQKWGGGSSPCPPGSLPLQITVHCACTFLALCSCLVTLSWIAPTHQKCTAFTY